MGPPLLLRCTAVLIHHPRRPPWVLPPGNFTLCLVCSTGCNGTWGRALTPPFRCALPTTTSGQGGGTPFQYRHPPFRPLLSPPSNTSLGLRHRHHRRQGVWCGPPLPPMPPPVCKPPHGLGVCMWMHLVNGTCNSPSPGQPTPGVVKQDKSSGGSVDTTKTRSGPQRVRMSSTERPIGAAKGKPSDTEALCQTPPPPTSEHPKAQQPPLQRGPAPLVPGCLPGDAPDQRRGPAPSAVWTRHGAVGQGKSRGSVGTTDQGKGKGSGEGKTGHGGRGRTRGG